MFNGGFILDHWGYWLAPAVLLPIALFFERLWTSRGSFRNRSLAMAFFPILIAYALLTRLNIELRPNDEMMFRWALHFTESHPIKYNLGVLLLKSGRAQEAIPYFEDVRSAYPENKDNTHALALAYWDTDHRKLAVRVLKWLVTSDPTYAPAVQSLKAATAALSKH